jgi:hypothetical protein
VNGSADIRWKQRFSNLEKAISLLREPILRIDTLSMLEKEGTVQRFEGALELAWKTLKDYLEFEGRTLHMAAFEDLLNFFLAKRNEP